MKRFTERLLILAAATLVAGTSIALADTASAMCEVRKEGETKAGASGPCDFSQRQGYVSITLKNGDRFELSPADKPDHYKDQKGKKVVLTVNGNANEYKWEGGKKIIVTFTSSGSTSSGSGAGSPVPGLQDLVGAKGGDGERALESRGYSFIRTDKSTGEPYSYWREKENGQCIVVHTSDGRYKSIVYATDFDCKGEGHGGSASAGDRREEFNSVCGVMVNGENYRYRCKVEDIYSGGNRTRTILHYPDQKIELTWESGGRVGLQFEGMVPKEARYSTSEGETNFRFEDKTYYYYSNKDLALREYDSFRE